MAVRVKISQGELEGTVKKSGNGADYLRFLGVPYAKAERFAKPTSPPGWEGVKKANNSIKCLQNDSLTGRGIAGKEDGLVANVYTPKSALDEGSSPLPVMVWIHGGGFFLGDGTPEFYGPGWLIDHGIVLVCINYRLGPLGFMNTGNDVIPANLVSQCSFYSQFNKDINKDCKFLPQGLWDQRQALVWVQENISKFGGDPGNVTIFGESAGSMSCAYHILSPQSAGLFHKAILESGNPFNPWCRQDKHPLHLTRQLVKAVDGPSDGTPEEILEFLKKADMKKLFKNCNCGTILGDENVLDPAEFFPFLPVVDDFCSEPFLPDEPVNLVKAGKFNHVPTIVGFNKDEGIMIKVVTEKAKPALLEKFNANLSKFAAFMFLNRNADEFDKVDEEVINKLLETSGVTELSKSPSVVEKVGNVYGDSFFVAPTLDFCKMMATSSNCPVYQYRFSYCPPATLLDVMIPNIPKLLCRLGKNCVFFMFYSQSHSSVPNFLPFVYVLQGNSEQSLQMGCAEGQAK